MAANEARQARYRERERQGLAMYYVTVPRQGAIMALHARGLGLHQAGGEVEAKLSELLVLEGSKKS